MINKVILIGNVGADPELRTLESGTKVVRLRLATTERIKKGDEWTDHTEWHSVVLWRMLAERADKFVRKGSQIYVEGSLRRNEWTDKDGAKRSDVEIIANDMRLLGRRPEGVQPAAPQSAAPAAAPSATSAPAAPEEPADDLPF